MKGVVYAVGPRAGGNSDAAAEMFAEGAAAAGAEVRVVRLRERKLIACVGCHACEPPPHRCPFMDEDEAEAFFGELLAADFVCFCSPVFFYHLPGAFKGVVDRAQRYWERMQAGDPELLRVPVRPSYAVMVAGRPKGERLFEGSLLTLKYFLLNFRVSAPEPLVFRGIDRKGDLRADAAACEAVREFGAMAGRGGHK